MPLTAFLAVLLAAAMHATWNLAAKRASGSRHFVWLYSAVSVTVYTPVVVWLVVHEPPHFGAAQWLALSATVFLHLGYSLVLQAGYRASDLSLVYPLARGSGPLLSFFAAVLLLGEPITTSSIVGVLLVVIGIVLLSGLATKRHRAPRVGVLYGLATGVFIAAYTVNDGWAVKALLIPPVLVDYSGNLFRLLVLGPLALRDSAGGARARARDVDRHVPRRAASERARGAGQDCGRRVHRRRRRESRVRRPFLGRGTKALVA